MKMTYQVFSFKSIWQYIFYSSLLHVSKCIFYNDTFNFLYFAQGQLEYKDKRLDFHAILRTGPMFSNNAQRWKWKSNWRKQVFVYPNFVKNKFLTELLLKYIIFISFMAENTGYVKKCANIKNWISTELVNLIIFLYHSNSQD